MKLSKASIALLVVQLAVVSSIAAKYLWQRHSCPRVWTRAAAYDPSLPMRGRYLSVQLLVDGCASTLPSAKLAQFPRNSDGTVKYGSVFTIPGSQTVTFPAKLQVKDGHLLAVRPDGVETMKGTQRVTASSAAPCSEMRLDEPVLFFLAEHAQSPLPALPGEQLWVEVTISPDGPPRPLQLAVKNAREWKVLDLK
jgi:hypothetical protein